MGGYRRGVSWEELWLVSFCSGLSVDHDRSGTEMGDEVQAGWTGQTRSGSALRTAAPNRWGPMRQKEVEF